MKITHKIMAVAIMLAIGLSTASAETKTNAWFEVNFETGYTANAVLAGISKTDGAWSKTGDDASTMTNQTASNVGRINGLGGSLIWTPTNAVGNRVLLDADVYMIGSEDAPATSVGDAQTEVFMTNVSESVSYLYAHVGDGGAGSKWVKLQGVPVSDMTWIHLRIEIDYDATPNMLSFYVGDSGGTKMSEDGVYTFPVMASGASATKVTSVSFMGTGYLDNFVGKTVTSVFGSGGVDTDGTHGAGGTVVEGSGVVNATFDATNSGEAIRYVQMTGPNGYVRSIRTATGNVSFSTVGLPAGTYSIIGYYGTQTLTTGLAAPAATTIGANKAAEVKDIGGVKSISFTVAPKSGLYYTVFAGPNPTSLTAGAVSVLASPADEDAGFIKLAMPVPTDANEVKIIKIYASDESFAKGDDAP